MLFCVCRLEPLLARIKEDRTAVLCPMIDLIDKDTLEYGGTGSFSVGGFWWSLHFSWRPIPIREHKRRKSEVDPIRYDPQLQGFFVFIFFLLFFLSLFLWGFFFVSFFFLFFFVLDSPIIPCSTKTFWRFFRIPSVSRKSVLEMTKMYYFYI